MGATPAEYYIKASLASLDEYLNSLSHLRLDSHVPEYVLAYRYKYEACFYESFRPNQLYGLTNLVRYLNGSYSGALNIIFVHGLSFDYVWHKEFKTGYPICIYSHRMMSAYLRGSLHYGLSVPIRKITFPVLALMRSSYYANVLSQANDRILVILKHSLSSLQVNSYLNLINVRRYLKSTVGDDVEINILLYCTDYVALIKSGVFDETAGLFDNVYCCGSQYDPLFSARLATILAHHRTIAIDHISTPAFLSIALDKSLTLLPPHLITDLAFRNEDARVDKIDRSRRGVAYNILYSNLLASDERKRRDILLNYIDINISSENDFSVFRELVDMQSSAASMFHFEDQISIDPIVWFSDNQ